MGSETPKIYAMGNLVVTPWKRYGKNRAYVNTSDGQRVGWVDLDTAVQTLERPDLAAEFAKVVHDYLGLVAPPTVDEVVEYDLALQRPGEGARLRAEEELAEMRSRTRVGTVIARTLDWKTDERAWRVGADGEKTVGARLERLRSYGWRVLHSVPVGKKGSDIDHVLIGPGGVYTINTKNHPGKKVWVGKHAIRVDGRSVSYLRNSRFEADRASDLLSAVAGFLVVTRPAIVFLTGGLITDLTIKQRPDDVLIFSRADVPRAFRQASKRLTSDQVEYLYEIARRRSTWQP